MSSNAQSARVQHLDPEGLFKNPAFSQVIVVSGAGRTVYVGGQNAVEARGAVVGAGDLRAQTEQVWRNLETALRAANATPEHMVKTTIYLVAGQDPRAAFEVYRRMWGGRGAPPTITVLMVSGLARPEHLIEIDAVAVVP